MEHVNELVAGWPVWTQAIAGAAALVLFAVLANILVKRVILRLIDRALVRLGLETGTAYLDPVARRLANVVPAIVVARGIAWIPRLPADAISFGRNVAHAAIIVAVVLALSAALDALNALYQRRPQAASRPIKGYLQVAKILLFGAAAILVAALLMDQSPLLLLSGLGAMAAVLMLVFKDTILSLVASVQLTSNDMLRVGDWIAAPQFDADGDVVDIALHTVKVQNFDRTITTIPTHRLIAEPFRNWRGMKETGARRIMRALLLDQTSVAFLSEDAETQLAQFQALGIYLKDKRAQIARWNAELDDRGEAAINRRALTNIGTFRAYVDHYLASHRGLRSDMTRIVRQLAPSPEGLPLEIYCFADTSDWGAYEAIQADIFDHLLAILPRFGLRLYQRPGGSDFRPRGGSIAAENWEDSQRNQEGEELPV
ncbi:mechanosensitive ion channel family protein [Novosphingobium sp. JCM 18896]|uniref:mechanosensitive ion channel family protein n=1 Tax=Novosphingobium sp. JCM 18896 TaxID=2989731 RepID=UPI002223C48E|nr:mechanosensitive ion channel family protein [Novosphingobium sp. JCM 18896]MCW1431682.1 mechanosensitive ion channel family protein [Novosphingobium sp. JCM 18896]